MHANTRTHAYTKLRAQLKQEADEKTTPGSAPSTAPSAGQPHHPAAVSAEAEQAQGAEGVGEEDTLMGDELAEDEGGEEVCVCYVWLVCECDCVCKCVCCCSCTCVLVYTHTHICLWARL